MNLNMICWIKSKVSDALDSCDWQHEEHIKAKLLNSETSTNVHLYINIFIKVLSNEPGNIVCSIPTLLLSAVSIGFIRVEVL